MSFIQTVEWPQIVGISPSISVVVGRGFVREEIKALAFREGYSLSADSVVSMDAWIQKFLPEPLKNWPMVSELGRRTLLEQLFRTEEAQTSFPLLTEKRRRRRFLERLDRELERGRSLFSDFSESEAQLLRWEELQGEDQILREYWKLAQVIETTFFNNETPVLDLPLLLRSVLQNPVQPTNHPRKVILLIAGPLLPLENALIVELRNFLEIEVRGVDEIKTKRTLQRRGAHTLEDSVAFLMDEISAEPEKEHAIVIEDDKNIRRVMNRCMRERGLVLRDPRNPMELLESEALKIELLELEMAVGRFDYSRAMTWMKAKDPTRVDQIRNSGQRDKLDEVIPELSEIRKKWPGRLSLREFIKILTPSLKSKEIESLLGDWLEQVRLFDADHVKRPLAVWAEQLSDSLRRVKPTTVGIRYESNIGIYRADQVPGLLISPKAKIHFFGLTDRAFRAEEEVYDFYSHRLCEKLSGDWALPVRAQKQELKENLMHAWCERGESCVSWEFLYDPHGKEQEDLSAAWSDAGIAYETAEWGVHPKYKNAYENLLQTVSAELNVSVPLESIPKKFTFLDSYGECSFKAYGRHVVKWENKKDSDWDVRADWRGKVLHSAVEKIVKFGSEIPVALEEAWHEHKAEGWFRSERIERATKFECQKILEEFMKDEIEYQKNSGTKAKIFERDLKLELEIEGEKFVGYSDRVDEHEDGLVVIDYKTSSNLPSAADMIKSARGYQLALYALSLNKLKKIPVIGAHYIRLARTNDPTRNRGVFFSEWNGKKAKKPLSNVRPNNGGFVKDTSPDEFWGEIEGRLSELVKRLKSGDFSANPLDTKICELCDYRVCCGRARRELLSDE